MRKAVEGLPLKYIILVIVAALVIELIITMTTGMRGGIMLSLGKINDTMINTTSSLP